MNYVYLTNPFLKSIIPLLDAQWIAMGSWDSPANLNKVTALATTVWEPINPNLLSQFPNLQIICHLGVGTDNIDLNYLEANKIQLFTQPTAGIHDTSELAMALMLSLARRIIPNDQYTRENHWQNNQPKLLGNHLKGKQLGLVGLGKIGSTIARFAEVFGMRISYTTRNPLKNNYVYYSNVQKLAMDSDFLIVCCSGGSETTNLIDQQVLNNLGPEGYLINVSRGSVVDQDALITALSQKTIAGAGLDVYSNEPEVPSALRMLDNVVLSPHMGSSTKENLAEMFQLQADQLNHFLSCLK